MWPIVLMICIFLVSGTSRLAVPDLEFKISKDKIGHFLVFGLVATAILRIPTITSLRWAGSLIAAGVTVLYGGFDEYRQSFTPGREVEFADWIADSAGAILATQLYYFWNGYRRTLERQIRWGRAKT